MLLSMQLDVSTMQLYVRHAYGGMARVLDRLDDETVNLRPPSWGTNSVAGLIVHCCELGPSWFETPGLGRDTERDREAEFVTTASVAELRARIDVATQRCDALLVELGAGPSATDHPLRAFLPGTDRTDAALALHVLEELFQHLGHMEVTADAVSRTG